MRQDIQSALLRLAVFSSPPPPPCLETTVPLWIKNSIYSPRLKFPGGRDCGNAFNLQKEKRISEACVGNSYSSLGLGFVLLFCFFLPLSKWWFLPKATASFFIVHSCYSTRLYLPLNENEEFSTGKGNVFWLSEHVDPGLCSRDHLSVWRQTFITATACEGINGLATQAELIVMAIQTSAVLVYRLRLWIFLGQCCLLRNLTRKLQEDTLITRAMLSSILCFLQLIYSRKEVMKLRIIN